MSINQTKNIFWRSIFIIAPIVLTLWQFDFIDWFPEYKLIFSRFIYMIAFCCLIYLFIHDFKNTDIDQHGNYILLPAALIFLFLLVYSFLPEKIKSLLLFMKLFE